MSASAEALPMPVILARSTLGSPGGVWEWQRMAITLIEQGYDCPALHELAWAEVISHCEVVPLWAAVMETFGWRPPSKEEAVEILFRYHLCRIAEGHCSPKDGLSQIINDVCWPEISEYEVTKYLGDSHGLEHLIGAYYSYNGLRGWPETVSYQGLYGQAAQSAFDEYVRGLAAAWVAERPVCNYGSAFQIRVHHPLFA